MPYHSLSSTLTALPFLSHLFFTPPFIFPCNFVVTSPLYFQLAFLVFCLSLFQALFSLASSSPAMSDGPAARSLPSVGSSSSFPHSSVVGAASPTAGGDGGRDGASRRLLIVANRLPVSMSIKQQTVGRNGTGGKR